jgi:filamentous hemagglutinin
LFGSDAQQAQEVAKFRSDSCAALSASACDGLVKEAINDRMMRVGVLTAVGGLTPVVASGVKGLIAPKLNGAGAYAIKPNPLAGDEDLPNVYSARKVVQVEGSTATAQQIAELVAEHSKTNTSPMTKAAAKTIFEQTQPAGSSVRVAGDNAQGPDVVFVDKTGLQAETMQLKSVVNEKKFEEAIRGDFRLKSEYQSSIIAVQVPEGTNPDRLMGKLLSNFKSYDVTGKSIIVVDDKGKVVIPLQPFPTKGGK